MRSVVVSTLRLSVIGLGGWQFGSPEWRWGTDFTEREAAYVIAQACHAGIRFFDTAERYGRGESERILGGLLRNAHKDEVVIGTKLWPSFPTDRRVARAARLSAQRLGVSAIDLYQVHWRNPLVPRRRFGRSLRRLLEDRLVRHVGVSNHSVREWERAERALGVPVVSNQVRFSLLTNRRNARCVRFAADTGRLVIAYSPLAQGLLARDGEKGGWPRDTRRLNLLFSPQNIDRARPVFEALRDVSQHHGATPGQIALAWVVHHPNVVAIPGARTPKQVAENAEAADLELSPLEFAHLSGAAAAFRRETVRSVLRSLRS